MDNKHMKQCSPSLAIKEMQIKTTLRFHLTPSDNLEDCHSDNKCQLGCKEKGDLVHCWWECKAATMGIRMESHQKAKNRPL
jgi:hypothetical protein